MFIVVAVMSVAFMSCKKTPAPTAEIDAAIEGYTVTFTSTVTDVDTYSWDFDEGGEKSIEANPVHTYAMSGTYNVTLVVKGDGGEATATKEIILPVSLEELLTGGTTSVNGKTWVLSQAAFAGTDGRGSVTDAMTIDTANSDYFLADYGLELEYDNEYTFYANNNYSVNTMNDNVLAGVVYASENFILQGEPAYDIGMCEASFTPPVSATWTLHTEDLEVDAITDPLTTDIPPDYSNVTFSGKTWISLSDGAFFGILDFPTTAQFIIKEITSEKMNVALFLCGYNYGDDLNMKMLPTNLIHLTFIPKVSE